MKVYVDINVVIADTFADHIHHANAAQLFLHIRRSRWTPVLSAHGLAEIYTVLTGTPFNRRPTPLAVEQMLQENVLESFEIQALSRSDYIEAIRYCAAQGVTGGRIYDALHISAARKAGCSRIYTFNIQHFRQLAPDLLNRIMAP